MSFNLDRSRRLEAIAIDDRIRSVLRGIASELEPHFDRAITAAYNRLMKYPEAARAYQGTSLESVIEGQRKHWFGGLLPATFSDDELEHMVELFQKRQKMGLSLRWFFVFYASVYRDFIKVLTAKLRKKPELLAEAIEALSSIVLLDLEIASAAYIQSSEDEAAAFIKVSAEELQARVAGLSGSVEAATTALRTGANTMAQIAVQTTGQVNSAASAFQVAQSNIHSAATATEELSASIQEINRQVERSAEVTNEAVTEAQRTDAIIQGLASAVDKIGAVVKLIHSIASQTNLLALNATIEAARAGDAGKGFAVVAGEVKNLANQTAKATEEISAQIGAVQSATGEAVRAIQGIGTTIGRINEIATIIAGAVEEQGAATHEIARSVQQVASSGSTVDENIMRVSSSAKENEEAAHSVLSSTTSLADGVKALGVELGGLSSQVTRFLEQTRHD